MKQILIGIALCAAVCAYGQKAFIGTVIDNESGEVLPYVNVGVVGKNVGTVANIKGMFSLKIDSKYDTDTLMISMIGYEDLFFVVGDFKEQLSINSTFKLASKRIDLQEIVIESSKLKSKILGNKTKSKNITGGFSSNELGNEVGIVIQIKKSPAYIDKFQVSIVENEFDSLKFRLNFYSVKNGMPHKSILTKNIFVESQIKEGVLTVDLGE